MITCKIDDTGIEFNSISKLANFLGCSAQRIAWLAKHRQDEPNHFRYGDYSITIIDDKNPKKRTRKYDPEYARQYYAEHKEVYKQWRENNKDKVKEYKKKWNSAHQEWYNAYYREQRRQKREKQND